MAGGFTDTVFIKKLAELNNSSQSIQTLSLWLIHHRKHYSTVVKIWLRELIKGKLKKEFIYSDNSTGLMTSKFVALKFCTFLR